MLKTNIALALLIVIAACVTGCADKNPDPGTPKSAAPAGGGGAGTPNAGAKGGVAPPGV